jgi:hypothetical protein
MAFWIEISDSSGTRHGRIASATGWDYTDPLDQAGMFAFSMPAADPAAGLLAERRIATCYTLIEGVITQVGSGIIDEIALGLDAEGNPVGTLAISGTNRLRELTYRMVGTLSIDNGAGGPDTSGPSDIIGLAPAGWSLDTEYGYAASAKAVLHQYAGETVLEALVRLTELTGEHFRAGVGRSVAWLQNDRPASGVRAYYNGSPNLITNPEGCLITSIERSSNSYESYVGRLYAIGAGSGAGQVTLNGASVPGGYTGYTLGTDSKGHYLEHSATWSTYGIERTVSWKDIADPQTLLEAAYEYLKRAQAPIVTYQLSLAGLRQALTPGSTIEVTAHAWTDQYHAINIERQNLVILEVTNRLDERGLRTVGLVCSTQDRRELTDLAAIARIAQTVQALAQHNQPV